MPWHSWRLIFGKRTSHCRASVEHRVTSHPSLKDGFWKPCRKIRLVERSFGFLSPIELDPCLILMNPPCRLLSTASSLIGYSNVITPEQEHWHLSYLNKSQLSKRSGVGKSENKQTLSATLSARGLQHIEYRLLCL